ncbi:glutamate formimidoyltransferase [Engelhardtia mirabilis]|uniref:Formimidoyltransferase-cyclodeaminase n=1 Tax=Engelhardtia mirabilis TaxID=2528011 RepID=A0A518BHE2_9BACT|nr:Methenyltetrahydrofolate cyclohydrolase [Planctomycetes bacterium Pla133]QDV00712.1 Methenyltetrahydrofolate cyclohydrolase [Planctomycetes bacterium Pla86]
MKRLVECVPNFSEGRDMAVIDRITARIAAVDGVELLDVDPGAATNRTVVTFVGEPEAVIEAAVEAGRAAAELIDMRGHSGEHPRFGAMDVCPLVPVAGLTMEETVPYAHELARRLGEEVGLSIYCYENAAKRPDRRNLATVRAGEYEGLPDRMASGDHTPDYGPKTFQPRTGATAVGAREFLVAYNVNLNTTSVRRANEIASRVREQGYYEREGDEPWGEIVKDAQGKAVRTPGRLKHVKGIGWFIEEYGIAQISMNLTNITATPVHEAFDAVVEEAASRGVRVTGSELVGLIPLSAMRAAGRHYLLKQRRSTGVSDAELIKIAIKSMGLDELGPFDPAKRIIEYAIRPAGKRLVDLTLRQFVEETASESVAPGGGSVAAALGAMGAALGTMVANLTSHKRSFEERWETYSEWAERGKRCHDEMLELIDRDTDSFNAIMAAGRLPKGTAEEERIRAEAMEEATLGAIAVPFRTIEVAVEALEVCKAMAELGNPASASDAGVGALCARAAARGAHLNVRINVPSLADPAKGEDFVRRGAELVARTEELERETLALVEANL